MVEPLQVPAPLQTAAVASLPLAQLEPAPHEVLSSGYTHAFRFWVLPSQTPAHTPEPAHAVRGVVTGVQVPLLFAVAHDSHWPTQATLQHTPSAHTPVPHSVEVLQASPMARPTHVPLLQTGVFPLQPPQQLVLGMHESLQSLVETLQVT